MGQRPANFDGFISALKLANWQGLEVWLRDHAGTDYQIKAPIIIGADAIQFATGHTLRPVSVPYSDIASFALA